MRYPVIVSSSFILTTLNSPAPLVVRKTGRVEQWLMKDGQRVNSGQVIAVLESEARFQDVLKLGETLETQSWATQKFLLSQDQLQIGTIRNAFSQFLRAREHLRQFNENNSLGQNRKLMGVEINRRTEFYNQMLLHRNIKHEEFVLVERRFRQDSNYYRQGRYGISLADYESSLQRFLKDKADFISYQASFYQHEAAIAKSKQELTQLTISHNKASVSLTEDLQVAHLKLLESINDWKSLHLITAPSSGTLTLTKYWSENQVLNTGETLATVVPEEKIEIIGRAIVSSDGIGKIKVGQKVNIKLSGFPSLQYGTLEGRVKSVSLVPEDNGYVAGIELSNGMTSSYKERLKFIQEMDGTAEIITESKRLIYKLLSL